MKLRDYKAVLIVLGFVGVLLFSSPSIQAAFPKVGQEQFSELYLLGPGHMAENYPSNIVAGQTYSVYVGVTNHFGSSAYYVLEVKFGNKTDGLPFSDSNAASSLPALLEYRFTSPDGIGWENPFSFSLENASISNNQSTIRQLNLNNLGFTVNKPALWDSNSTKYSYVLIFELWLFNATTNAVQFNNRFVTLQLNLTSTT